MKTSEYKAFEVTLVLSLDVFWPRKSQCNIKYCSKSQLRWQKRHGLEANGFLYDAAAHRKSSINWASCYNAQGSHTHRTPIYTKKLTIFMVTPQREQVGPQSSPLISFQMMTGYLQSFVNTQWHSEWVLLRKARDFFELWYVRSKFSFLQSSLKIKKVCLSFWSYVSFTFKWVVVIRITFSELDVFPY